MGMSVYSHDFIFNVFFLGVCGSLGGGSLGGGSLGGGSLGVWFTQSLGKVTQSLAKLT